MSKQIYDDRGTVPPYFYDSDQGDDREQRIRSLHNGCGSICDLNYLLTLLDATRAVRDTALGKWACLQTADDERARLYVEATRELARLRKAHKQLVTTLTEIIGGCNCYQCQRVREAVAAAEEDS